MTTPSGHRPTVGQTFKTGKHGELIFESWLPEDWIARKQSPDFFVDYYVEIVQRGEPTGKQCGLFGVALAGPPINLSFLNVKVVPKPVDSAGNQIIEVMGNESTQKLIEKS